MTLPYPLSRVAELGHKVFYGWKNLNLVVVRKGHSTPGAGDDTCYLMWQERADGPFHARIFCCESEPGIGYLTNPINPKGAAIIAPGQYPSAYKRGLHKGRPALVQHAKIKVFRDNDRDRVIELDPKTLDDGIHAVNFHDVTAFGQLAGCIGVLPADMAEVLDVYDDCAKAYGPLVTLTVIDG